MQKRTVRVGTLDRDSLQRDRNQIWAEAVELYRAGTRWWPMGEVECAALADAAEERYATDPWEQRIAEHMAGAAGAQTVAGLLSSVLKVEVDRQDRASATRVGTILSRLGYQPRQRTVGGVRERVYYGEAGGRVLSGPGRS
jgi:predicted P-loop ATPase